MIIAIDFDGTCVEHDYPKVGKDIGAVPVLKELVANGHQLILYTMRSGDALVEAQNWFRDNDITLYASQMNPTQKDWTLSNKCYAQLYIDDAALGCPLINETYPESSIMKRSFVDWVTVRELLVRQGYLK